MVIFGHASHPLSEKGRRGDLPRRALALVLEWAALHRAQLKRDWELARTGQTPERIAPLD